MWHLLSQADRFLSPLIFLVLSFMVSWHTGLSFSERCRKGARGNRLPSNSAPPCFWLATRAIADVGDTTFLLVRPTVPIRLLSVISCNLQLMAAYIVPSMQASDNAPPTIGKSVLSLLLKLTECRNGLMIRGHRI